MTGQLKALLAATVLLSGLQAQAADYRDSQLSHYADFGFATSTEMKNYFAVDKIEVQERAALVTPEVTEHLNNLLAAQKEAAKPAQPAQPSGVTPADVFEDLTGLDAKSWITLGQKIWQIILDNKPVAKVSTQRVSVLPMTQQDWAQMESWQGPALKTFTVSAKNLYGMTVMSHTYTIAFNYGGSYKGKGQFIANATVIPAQIDVSWGFSLNSEVEVGDVVNTGTTEAPVPGLDLQLKWTMDSVLKHLEGREDYYIKGDGSILQIATGL